MTPAAQSSIFFSGGTRHATSSGDLQCLSGAADNSRAFKEIVDASVAAVGDSQCLSGAVDGHRLADESTETHVMKKEVSNPIAAGPASCIRKGGTSSVGRTQT